MYKTIQNIAAFVFIISVTILTLVAILAVWDVFDGDVVWKSLSTIGILAFASVVVIFAAKAVERHQDAPTITNSQQ